MFTSHHLLFTWSSQTPTDHNSQRERCITQLEGTVRLSPSIVLSGNIAAAYRCWILFLRTTGIMPREMTPRLKALSHCTYQASWKSLAVCLCYLLDLEPHWAPGSRKPSDNAELYKEPPSPPPRNLLSHSNDNGSLTLQTSQ